MKESLEELEQFAIDVILNRRKGFRASTLRVLLSGMSVIYRYLVSLRLWLYKSRIKREHNLGCLVVSIGNLTVGGTGKTPIVEKFAKALTAGGRRVAILSRGYKSVKQTLKQKISNKVKGNPIRQEPPRVVTDGKEVLLDSKTAGDEPYMLATNLKDVAIVVDKDRVKAGLHAIREFDACAPTLLKLDIEGSELAVLEGAGDALSGVLAVKAEAAFLPLRKDQPLATDILTFMEDAGFCLMDMIDSHLWRVRPWAGDPFLVRETPAYSRGRLVQTDLLFLRDIANLDEQRAFSAMLAAAGLGYFDHAIEILNAFPSIISERSGADTTQMRGVLAETAKSYGRARLGKEICQAVKHFARLVRSGSVGLAVPPHG